MLVTLKLLVPCAMLTLPKMNGKSFMLKQESASCWAMGQSPKHTNSMTFNDKKCSLVVMSFSMRQSVKSRSP